MEDKNYSEEVKKKYQNINDTFNKFNHKDITILTGNNGSGKSLIRTQIPFYFRDMFKLKNIKDTKGMVKSTSMDARTQSRPEFGGLSGILNDTSWIATSQNTFHSIKGLLQSIEKSERKETKYIIIDEYEIGCSEETIIALSKYINDYLHKLIDNNIIDGAMIITHSRIGSEYLKWNHFLNIEGKSYDEWINRKIIPTDLDELEKNELFLYIRDFNK